MANKIVIYRLNKNGTIPKSIDDGGYYPIKNSKPSPQDYDLIGATKDGSNFTGEGEFLTKEELKLYLDKKGPFYQLDFEDPGNFLLVNTTDSSVELFNKKI